MKQYPKAKSLRSVLWVIIKAKVTGDTSKHISYLKCDKKGCLHTEFHDELTFEHIGKPCPVCGTNLLTVSDFAGREK